MCWSQRSLPGAIGLPAPNLFSAPLDGVRQLQDNDAISSQTQHLMSNMADPKAQEAAVKERIVNHMNKDHADSVSHSGCNIEARRAC